MIVVAIVRKSWWQPSPSWSRVSNGRYRTHSSGHDDSFLVRLGHDDVSTTTPSWIIDRSDWDQIVVVVVTRMHGYPCFVVAVVG